jgi:hypothetical protein
LEKFGLNQLREMFLSFFESKGHLRLPSFSLIPQNDPSLLLINAGMSPMKTWFTGEEEPPCHRVCTCQKCIRTGDIENIGKTARHGTYFEMLGNFSFGDYFKHEAIAWGWEFLTSPAWVGIDPTRLYPSVYLDDDEAWNIWHDEIGIPADRIFRFGKGATSGSTARPLRPLLGDLLRPRRAVRLRQSRTVPSAATAIGTSRSGISFSPNSTTTAIIIIRNWRRKISTPAWASNGLPWSARAWTACSMWTPS